MPDQQPAVKPLRAVYAHPGNGYEYNEDGEKTTPHVGWDIAFGCRVSFGPCELYDGTPFAVTVSVSDDVQRGGIAKREVTPAQVRAFAYHLLAMCAELEAEGA